mgnify:CR=1 FL=1
MKYFNIFGDYIDDSIPSTIETFADTNQESESTLERINSIIEKINVGVISNNDAEKFLLEFKDMEKSKKLNSDETKAVAELEKVFAQKVKGINLVGNLQLGGYVKAKGYYLEDGTKINQITKEIKAIPYDDDKNIDIQSIENKNINMTAVGNGKVNVNKLNIPKSGRLTFGDGEDNDPYHIRKIGGKDGNQLRVTLNDNNNESLQVWGNSCNGDKCDADGGKFYHGFYTNGNAVHTNNLGIGNTNPQSRLSVQNVNRSDETKDILETGFIPTAELKQFHSTSKDVNGGWGGPSLQFKINNGSNGGGAIWPAGTIVGSADPIGSQGGYDGGLLFYTAAGGLNKPQQLAFAIGRNDQRAYFKGKVGVGTKNPEQKLHVNGNAQVDGNLKVKSLEIGNYKVYEKDKHLLFHNKDNNGTVLSLNPNGSITVKTANGQSGGHLNNTLFWCNDSNYQCKK